MPHRIPLILLPGMLCDGAFWRAQMRDLGDVADCRVAGYGLADDFDTMADIVLATAPQSFALAGHSMGGRVALEIVRRAPGRVRALALIATDYRGHSNEEARAAEAARRGATLAKIAAEGLEGFARFWTPQVVAPANMGNAALVEDVVAMMVRQSPQAASAQTLAGLIRRDQTDVLPTISCPTLVCAGWDDTLRPVSIHREMAALIPGSRLAVIEGSSHMIAMERPDALTADMRSWLARLR
ncbi:MAG TPA: alpha/beta fold hydrolase [Rhizomicrobium sp.]|nr:alpha/beta fold hydrolase [Rhizomicrobium sp.]